MVTESFLLTKNGNKVRTSELRSENCSHTGSGTETLESGLELMIRFKEMPARGSLRGNGSIERLFLYFRKLNLRATMAPSAVNSYRKTVAPLVTLEEHAINSSGSRLYMGRKLIGGPQTDKEYRQGFVLEIHSSHRGIHTALVTERGRTDLPLYGACDGKGNQWISPANLNGRL